VSLAVKGDADQNRADRVQQFRIRDQPDQTWTLGRLCPGWGEMAVESGARGSPDPAHVGQAVGPGCLWARRSGSWPQSMPSQMAVRLQGGYRGFQQLALDQHLTNFALSRSLEPLTLELLAGSRPGGQDGLCSHEGVCCHPG
jgi:hypothetical protein